MLLRMKEESSWGWDLQGHSPSLDPNSDGSGCLGVAVEPPTTLQPRALHQELRTEGVCSLLVH